jgi:hypothetical protein
MTKFREANTANAPPIPTRELEGKSRREAAAESGPPLQLANPRSPSRLF